MGERRNQRKMQMRETRQNAQAEKIKIKPEDIDRSDLNIFKVPDGGSVNPAVPSHDGMVPSGPSDANSHIHSHTHSPAHIPTHSDTHTPPDSDTHPHNDSHRTLIACKKSFAAYFLMI